MCRSEYEYDSGGSYEYESGDEQGEGAAGAAASSSSPARAPAPAAAAAAAASSAADSPSPSKPGLRSRVAALTSLFAAEGRDYRVFGPRAVQSEIDAAVASVAGALEVPEDDAEALLLTSNWDRERLLEHYLEDPQRERERAGVAAPSAAPGSSLDCPVCFDTRPASEMAAMPCGHAACMQCWAGYLQTRLSSNAAEAVDARCVAEGCDRIVPHGFVTRVARAWSGEDGGRMQAAWSGALCRHFVEHNRRLRWCPGVGCERAFQAVTTGKDVECGSCGSTFCLGCGLDAHRPADCGMTARWLAKCEDESETANWILVNTKRCPKCSVRIEKNQGCMHMKCRVCKHEFCWVCLGLWTEHGQKTGGYYACNRYDARKAAAATKAAAASSASSSSSRSGRGGGSKAASAAEIEADLAKQELDRYLFYFQRYSGHMRAGKFAEAQRRKTQQRMEEVASEGLSWSDVDFLEQGTEVLLACRRVLQHSYVMAFWLADGKEKSLFEHLQEMLEGSTEELSELLEQPLEDMDRRQVVNFTRVTAKFLAQLLEGVDEGLTGAGAATA